jgi:hypothetical protein
VPSPLPTFAWRPSRRTPKRRWCPRGASGATGATARLSAPHVPYDWNGNSLIDTTPVSVDIDFNGALTILHDRDDWSNLAYDAVTESAGSKRRTEIVVCR